MYVMLGFRRFCCNWNGGHALSAGGSIGTLLSASIPSSMASLSTKQSNDLDKLFSQKMPRRAAGQGDEGLTKNSYTAFLSENSKRALEKIRDLMRDAIQMKKTEMPDLTLSRLREAYLELDRENRKRALVVLALQFGVDRRRVLDLIKHYTTLNIDGKEESEGAESARYRVEHDLRSALIPLSARLFEQMNGQPGGLKFLVDLRADLLNTVNFFTGSVASQSGTTVIDVRPNCVWI